MIRKRLFVNRENKRRKKIVYWGYPSAPNALACVISTGSDGSDSKSTQQIEGACANLGKSALTGKNFVSFRVFSLLKKNWEFLCFGMIDVECL